MQRTVESGGYLPWTISIFGSGFTSVSPTKVSVKHTRQLEKLFKHPPLKSRDAQKKFLSCWSPALYEDGQTRKNVNVKKLSALVYDFDSTTVAPQLAANKLREDNRAFAIYTTWSHTKSNPRFRLILFTSRDILPHEFKNVWENGLSLIDFIDGVDRQCRDVARHYALPVKRADAEEYMGDFETNGEVVDVDSLALPKVKKSMELTLETVLRLQSGTATVKELVDKGEGKTRCACPFEEDASFGSAFLRVMGDGRAFIQCTSERHTHEGKQFWLKKGRDKVKKSPPRSVDARMLRLGELPEQLVEYAEKKIVYCSPQGVFYRREQGAWQVSMQTRKDTLVYHLIGLLPSGCDSRHAHSLVDHILSRQAYGFDCSSKAGSIMRTKRGRMINLYAKPQIEPKAGKWERISQIIDVLCAHDEKSRKWLINWSAALIQNPERRSLVAVIALSPYQGIGKSLYGRILSEIIGTGNVSVVSNRALRDRFNSSYVTALLVLADEVGVDPRSTDVINELKGYITDEEVHCAAPYAARMKVKNRMSWWMTSNHRRPLVLDENDRRVTVLAAAYPTPEYRKTLRGCFNSHTGTFDDSFRDEINAYAEKLYTMQIDWKLIANPLDTEARRRVQKASKSSIDGFLDDLKKFGLLSILQNYKPRLAPRIADSVLENCVPCELLYGSYREWCERLGHLDIKSEAEFHLAVISLPRGETKMARLAGTRFRAYIGLSKPKKNESAVVQFPAN